MRRAGFDPVDAGRDGIEALKLMTSRTYCLVVLDLRMPRLSRYDVLARITANPLRAMPKIVIATADRTARDHYLSAELVTAILTKPYDLDTFIAAIRSCIPEAA